MSIDSDLTSVLLTRGSVTHSKKHFILWYNWNKFHGNNIYPCHVHTPWYFLLYLIWFFKVLAITVEIDFTTHLQVVTYSWNNIAFICCLLWTAKCRPLDVPERCREDGLRIPLAMRSKKGLCIRKQTVTLPRPEAQGVSRTQGGKAGWVGVGWQC